MHYKATLDKIQEQNLNYLLTHNLELIVSDSKTAYKHTFQPPWRSKRHFDKDTSGESNTLFVIDTFQVNQKLIKSTFLIRLYVFIIIFPVV